MTVRQLNEYRFKKAGAPMPLMLIFGILLCVLLALLFDWLRGEVQNRAARGALTGLAVASLLYAVLLGLLLFNALMT